MNRIMSRQMNSLHTFIYINSFIAGLTLYITCLVRRTPEYLCILKYIPGQAWYKLLPESFHSSLSPSLIKVKLFASCVTQFRNSHPQVSLAVSALQTASLQTPFLNRLYLRLQAGVTCVWFVDVAVFKLVWASNRCPRAAYSPLPSDAKWTQIWWIRKQVAVKKCRV